MFSQRFRNIYPFLFSDLEVVFFVRLKRVPPEPIKISGMTSSMSDGIKELPFSENAKSPARPQINALQQAAVKALFPANSPAAAPAKISPVPPTVMPALPVVLYLTQPSAGLKMASDGPFKRIVAFNSWPMKAAYFSISVGSAWLLLDGSSMLKNAAILLNSL